MDEPKRLSLSEERLQFQLELAMAKMEINLRAYFDEQLKHKADSAPLILLTAKVDALDRGDFTDVHRRALTEFISQHERTETGKVWTRNERWFGALGLAIAILMAITAIYFGVSAQAQAAPGETAPQAATEVAL